MYLDKGVSSGFASSGTCSPDNRQAMPRWPIGGSDPGRFFVLHPAAPALKPLRRRWDVLSPTKYRSRSVADLHQPTKLAGEKERELYTGAEQEEAPNNQTK